MGSIYYHNITQNWYNENNLTDAVENTKIGDIVKYSVRGNAILFNIDNLDDNDKEFSEYNWVREEFKVAFEEYNK